MLAQYVQMIKRYWVAFCSLLSSSFFIPTFHLAAAYGILLYYMEMKRMDKTEKVKAFFNKHPQVYNELINFSKKSCRQRLLFEPTPQELQETNKSEIMIKSGEKYEIRPEYISFILYDYLKADFKIKDFVSFIIKILS